MNRWEAIAGVVGFLSAAIALVQAFNFTHLDRIECSTLGDRGRMMNCVYDLNSHIGEVVMLDWQTHVGDPLPGSNENWQRRRPFERRTEDDWVGWQLEPCTFATEIGRECAFTGDQYNSGMATAYWEQTARRLEARFSDGALRWEDMPFPDNGLSVRIRGHGQVANPYSSFEIETEGYDIARGPYQISMSNRDANFVLWLSPAPMTDTLPAQVRCAERDWPQILKFFACPFG